MQMKAKILGCVLSAAAAAGMLCACGGTAGSSQPTTTGQPTTAASAATASQAAASGEKRRLIIDTDTGADDASALILAAKTPNVEIVGVTVLVGNVGLEQSASNALAALETAGCDAPVYKGSADTFDGAEKDAFSVFGTDGMGDADLIHPQKQAAEGDAVDFILNTVKENPGEIEIVALGPATNLAKAIQRDPETMRQVKQIWSMGTAGLGPGNASPVAEFNVYADAQAYKVLLDSELPVTVIGLDMCGGSAMWTDAQFEALTALNDTGKFVAQSFGKLREFYRQNGSETVMNCDSLAMMCVLYPGFVRDTLDMHGSCITDKGETYAQVLFYQKGYTYDAAKNDFVYNVTLVTDVDKDAYFENYKTALQ